MGRLSAADHQLIKPPFLPCAGAVLKHREKQQLNIIIKAKAMKNTPITETHIWTTVLRVINVTDQCEVELADDWELESAADEAGLNITKVFFGDALTDIEGRAVIWDYKYHYEVERKRDGLVEKWWPVLHRPAPVQPRPTYNVLVLLDKHGNIEVGTDGLLNVFILDETIKDHPNEPSEQEKQFFNLVWDRLPEHRGVDDNPSIYDFSAVGL